MEQVRFAHDWMVGVVATNPKASLWLILGLLVLLVVT